jgi:hypothetical protein
MDLNINICGEGEPVRREKGKGESAINQFDPSTLSICVEKA